MNAKVIAVVLALALVAAAVPNLGPFNFRISAYIDDACAERLATISCESDSCCSYSEDGQTGYFVIENYNNATKSGDVKFNGNSCNADTLITNGADCTDVALNGTCFTCGFLNYKVVESSAATTAASIVLLAGSVLAALAF